MLDETGIVVALHSEHISPVSRHLAFLYEEKCGKRVGPHRNYTISNTFKVQQTTGKK
jgi:hypothetical protein